MPPAIGKNPLKPKRNRDNAFLLQNPYLRASLYLYSLPFLSLSTVSLTAPPAIRRGFCVILATPEIHSLHPPAAVAVRGRRGLLLVSEPLYQEPACQCKPPECIAFRYNHPAGYLDFYRFHIKIKLIVVGRIAPYSALLHSASCLSWPELSGPLCLRRSLQAGACAARLPASSFR